MKVEQADSPFQPITITLETKEEADLMWHLTNFALIERFINMNGTNYTFDELTRFKSRLWSELCNHHKPKQH